MDITYQYYNEIVLGFGDYEIDLANGTIVIEVPDSNKPFEAVCLKIREHLDRISQTLEPRNKKIAIKIVRGEETFDITLEEEEQAE